MKKRIIQKAYNDLLSSKFHNQILSKKFRIYNTWMFDEVPDLKEVLKYYVPRQKVRDSIHDNIGVIEKGIENPSELSKVIRKKQPNTIARIEISSYGDVKIRDLEHMHQGVLRNKPSLALVKSLKELGMTQKEISEELEKAKSTISQQCSQIRKLEERAEWTYEESQL